jgi:hypothetical protein
LYLKHIGLQEYNNPTESQQKILEINLEEEAQEEA